jgi:hypothetical protein
MRWRRKWVLTRAQQPGARRLGDEVARPAFEPAHFDVLVAHRRHEDDRHRFEAHVLAQRPAQVEPASARHVHVEQDQLGNAQVDLELGLGGARGKPRSAEVFQLADDDPCCDRIVVYQKNVDIHENGLPALSAPEVRQFRPFPSCRGRLDCRRNACGPFMQHETESLPPTAIDACDPNGANLSPRIPPGNHVAAPFCRGSGTALPAAPARPDP